MNKLKWTLNLQKYPATVITNLMTEKEVSTWALRLPQIPSTNLKGNAFFDHFFSPWYKSVNRLKKSGLYFFILPSWYYPFKGSLPNHWIESIDACWTENKSPHPSHYNTWVLWSGWLGGALYLCQISFLAHVLHHFCLYFIGHACILRFKLCNLWPPTSLTI